MWIQDIANFFGAERYSQHALCLTNDPVMIWFYTGAGIVIGVSYITISTVLILARQIGVRPEPIAFVLFAAFILACGLTHLTGVLTLFFGVYRLDVLVHIATACISASAAFYSVKSAIDAHRMV